MIQRTTKPSNWSYLGLFILYVELRLTVWFEVNHGICNYWIYLMQGIPSFNLILYVCFNSYPYRCLLDVIWSWAWIEQIWHIFTVQNTCTPNARPNVCVNFYNNLVLGVFCFSVFLSTGPRIDLNPRVYTCWTRKPTLCSISVLILVRSTLFLLTPLDE